MIKEKKSELSVFLILAVIIIIIFALIFFLSGNLRDRIINPSERLSIKNYVENNLKLSAEHCIAKIGLQGGRYNPENYIEKSFSDIEYAYNNENNFLNIESLKREIENCIKEEMPKCINDFKEFKKMGYKIEHGSIVPNVVLAKQEIPIKINFNVKSTLKDKQDNFKEFKSKISVRLKELHNITSSITILKSSQIKDSDFDLSYLGSLDTNTSIYNEKDNNQIYLLKNHDSKILNKHYAFLFSARH